MRHCSFDGYLSMSLALKMQVLPLTRQLTTLGGNLWTKTLLGSRSGRNAFLLLHEFHRNKFICPEKRVNAKGRDDDEEEVPQDEAEQEQSKSSRRKPQYSGGLVLEPKAGFYDSFVILLDFNSLYPSIIQEYNIDFTTVPPPEKNDEIPNIPDSNLETGLLPKIISGLVKRRREVKKLMKNPKLSSIEYSQVESFSLKNLTSASLISVKKHLK